MKKYLLVLCLFLSGCATGLQPTKTMNEIDKNNKEIVNKARTIIGITRGQLEIYNDKKHDEVIGQAVLNLSKSEGLLGGALVDKSTVQQTDTKALQEQIDKTYQSGLQIIESNKQLQEQLNEITQKLNARDIEYRAAEARMRAFNIKLFCVLGVIVIVVVAVFLYIPPSFVKSILGILNR